MGDEWIAQAVFMLEPFWRNLLENHAGIQFIHRTIAWILLIIIPLLLWKNKKYVKSDRQEKASRFMHIALGVQFLLGVGTLVMEVPVSIAAAHQAGAYILFGSAIYLNHSFFKE
jgi:cytochrome c oxidase assembly protein subunit 15